jgi:uncharacterized RDD family membrane protein YckC
VSKTPDYSTCSLTELYQVLNDIRADEYPENFAALEAEILSRESSSLLELEECYKLIDKARYPEHAARIVARIEVVEREEAAAEAAERARIAAIDPAELLEAVKYHTFWRRFGAWIFDLVMIGAPWFVIASAVRNAQLLGDREMVQLIACSGVLLLWYFIRSTARHGRTLGKRMTGLKVFHKDESTPVTAWQALRRDVLPLVVTLGLLSFSFVYTPTYAAGAPDMPAIAMGAVLNAWIAWALLEQITMLFSKRRRGLPDFVARTVVLRVRWKISWRWPWRRAASA